MSSNRLPVSACDEDSDIYEFLSRTYLKIRASELIEALFMLRDFMHRRNLFSSFPEPNLTAALAFALGLRRGRHLERRKRKTHPQKL